MSDSRYRISTSGATAEQLRAMMAESERIGRELETVRALRRIVEELKRTPSEFGESREGTDPERLQMRIGCVEPVWVVFGVHEPSRTVFISRIWIHKP